MKQPAWVVIDNWLKGTDVAVLAAEIASMKEGWVTYNNADEKKKTCNDVKCFPGSAKRLIESMQGGLIETVQSQINVRNLMSDPLLHGGGLHVSGNGGTLSVHLDYAKHPKLPLLERRANAIVYLTPEWQDSWGGATILTKPDGVTVLNRCYPAPGRLLIFETNDLSYHGVEPVTCPEGVSRVTMATYYLSVLREGVTRERALFVPNRGLPLASPQ